MAQNRATTALRRLVRRRSERGSITVLVAIVLGGGVLFGMTALVVDVGRVYVEREELQSGADAAALAVAELCSDLAEAGGQCNDAGRIEPNNLDLTKAWGTARKYARGNAKDQRTFVYDVCGNWGGLNECSGLSDRLADCVGTRPAQYVEVRVRTEMADGRQLLPPTFSRAAKGNGDYEGTSLAACGRATPFQLEQAAPTPSPEATPTTPPDPDCVSAAEARFRHEFGNADEGQAAITPEEPLCVGEQVTMVSYTAPSVETDFPQYKYDSQTIVVRDETRYTFQIRVPDCYTQVDLVFGTAPDRLNAATLGHSKLGSSGYPGNRSSGNPRGWYHGGSRACAPRPAVTFTSKCNGSLDVTLSNGSTANIDAAFTVTAGGTSTFLRVVKGSPTTRTFTGTAANNVRVDDNLFRTTTGRWTQPGGC